MIQRKPRGAPSCIGQTLIVLATIGFAAFVLKSIYDTEPVRILESRIQRQGGRVKVEGRLTNAGEDLGIVELEVRYYDRRGRQIGKDITRLRDVRSHAVRHFKTSGLIIQGVAKFSILLNHRPNPYGN